MRRGIRSSFVAIRFSGKTRVSLVRVNRSLVLTVPTAPRLAVFAFSAALVVTSSVGFYFDAVSATGGMMEISHTPRGTRFHAIRSYAAARPTTNHRRKIPSTVTSSRVGDRPTRPPIHPRLISSRTFCLVRLCRVHLVQTFRRTPPPRPPFPNSSRSAIIKVSVC